MLTPRSPLVGIGCMRLSTEPDRDERRAIEVLHAALDAGITFLDTADAYCHHDGDVGHNERLIARALATWTGDASRIIVATKGGLTRPHGQWAADGRAKHLAAACEGSLQALGVERVRLYQLHAVDPRTPLTTSVRALVSLQRRGLIESIGLCNVTVGQIEAARRLAEIAAVQVELGPWQDAALLNGVAEYCLAHQITLIAYRPLGGVKRRQRTARDAVLSMVAERHSATPAEIALAWLADLSPFVLPIPGPTQVATARSAARARAIALDDADRRALDERMPAVRAVRGGTAVPTPAQLLAGREVVLIMGLPGAGKSTLAETLVARGYSRLNRDTSGGSLADLVPALRTCLAGGSSGVVLDNTYVSRLSRAPVIRAAAEHGIAVRCVWLSTSLEEAQVNAVSRLVARYGRLPTPEEIAAAGRRDPAAFGPTVQARYQRELEPPDLAEGFSQIDIVPFDRRRDPSRVNRAVIVWCDGILWQSRSGRRAPVAADDVAVWAERGQVLQRYRQEGWRLLGLSWQPEIAEGTAAVAGVDAALARMRALLGLDIEFAYCPHAAGPPRCWCRKPLPGLGVGFIHQHALDATMCLYVGKSPQDALFARRMGFQYRDAEEFFADPGGHDRRASPRP